MKTGALLSPEVSSTTPTMTAITAAPLTHASEKLGAPRGLLARCRGKVSRILTQSSLVRPLLSVVDQAVSSGTHFATCVVLGRTCSPDELGTFSLAFSLVLLSRGVQEQLITGPFAVLSHGRQPAAVGEGLESPPSSESTAQQSGGEQIGFDEPALYGGSVLAHQLLLSLALSVAVAAGALWLSTGSMFRDLAPLLLVVAGLLPLMLLRDFVRYFSLARLKTEGALLVDMTAAVVQLGGIGWIAWNGRVSPLSVYGVMAAACGVASLGWFALSGERFVIRLGAMLSDWRRNWNFGRWALAGQMLGTAAAYLMPWIIAGGHGEAETGRLSACNSIIGAANLFVLGIANYLSPKASQAFQQGGIAALDRLVRVMNVAFSLLLGSFCLLVLVTGDGLAVLVYGDRFQDVGTILLLLSLGVLANGLGVVAGNGLWAMRRPAANFMADACVLVATAFATWLLVPEWGATGAAGATLVGMVLGSVLRMTTYRLAARGLRGGETLESGVGSVDRSDRQREGDLS